MDDEMKFSIAILVIIIIIARNELKELYSDVKQIIKSNKDEWR